MSRRQNGSTRLSQDEKVLIVAYLWTQNSRILEVVRDGLVGDDGVLEVKCPASQAWRNSTPSDCCDDPNFYCALNEKGDPTLKKTHKYYYQFQGQMAISSRKWCDFVVWTLKGINIERIEFDEDFWNEIAVKLDKFYLQAVLPELFSSRVKRGLSLFPM